MPAGRPIISATTETGSPATVRSITASAWSARQGGDEGEGRLGGDRRLESSRWCRRCRAAGRARPTSTSDSFRRVDWRRQSMCRWRAMVKSHARKALSFPSKLESFPRDLQPGVGGQIVSRLAPDHSADSGGDRAGRCARWRRRRPRLPCLARVSRCSKSSGISAARDATDTKSAGSVASTAS